MGNSGSNHQPLERGQIGRFGDLTMRRSLRTPRKMDRLRKSFRDSFRKRKEQRVPESSKPHQWQADEVAVRNGTCTFSVKYLGCVEVFESRGMQVCEEALKVLRTSRRRPIRALFHISGDGLRVVEDETKGLIVDQTIEKVSFCAPDRNHERGFSYICRDGTTRRWMCHGFLALRESGERLSHAVGCAFAVCLERKQRRDKECGVTMTFDMKNSTFTRSGSFRQPSLTERLEKTMDINNKKPPPVNPFAIERPHATPSMLERQGSFRGFDQLNQNSPFKRQMSLRITDLPSNTERTRNFLSAATTPTGNGIKSVSPIPEVSPGDTVAALCQQLSHGLSQLTHSESDDYISNKFDNKTISDSNNSTTTTTTTILSNNLNNVFSNAIPINQNITISTNFHINNTQQAQVQNITQAQQRNFDFKNFNVKSIVDTKTSNDQLTTTVLSKGYESRAPSLNKYSKFQSLDLDHFAPPGSGARNIPQVNPRIVSTNGTLETNNKFSTDYTTVTEKPSVSVPPTFINNSSNSNDSSYGTNTSTTSSTYQQNVSPLTIKHRSSISSASPCSSLSGPDTSDEKGEVSLPKPEQWLGQIVQNTAIVAPIAKRPLAFGSHSRTMSLGSAESFITRPNVFDPFDADWVGAAVASRQIDTTTSGTTIVHNTNPFLTAQPFQVQL